MATAKTEVFLARGPDVPLHQPEIHQKWFAELFKLAGPEKVEADKVVKLSVEFNFPAAAKACPLVGKDIHAVLVKSKRGTELAEKFLREKHLTNTERRKAQRFSVNPDQSEFFQAPANGSIYQPAELEL